MAFNRHKDRSQPRPPGPDPHPRVIHRVQYMALLFFEALVRFFPMSWVQRLGAGIGILVHTVNRPHRRYALINLDLTLGNSIGEAEKRQIVLRCYKHLGRALLETLRLQKLTKENFSDWVELENIDVFDRCLESGKGVILCTAHYGNWEVMNQVLGYLNLPMSVMARPMDNPLVHNHLERIRTRTNNQVIYKHKSVRKLLTALSENRIVGIVNDQNVHDRNRLMVPFFGRPAATTPVPAAIAYKTGAAIVTGYSVPLGGGRYLLRYDEPIFADAQAEKTAETLRITQLLNDRLEAQIRKVPHCWFWVHKRFKMDEHGLTDLYRQARKI